MDIFEIVLQVNLILIAFTEAVDWGVGKRKNRNDAISDLSK